jgi:hypothetical protein
VLVRDLKTNKIQITRSYKVMPGIYAYLNCKQPQPAVENQLDVSSQTGQRTTNQNSEDLSLVVHRPEEVSLGDYYASHGQINYDEIFDNQMRSPFSAMTSTEEIRRSGREPQLSNKALDNLASLSILPRDKVLEREAYVNPSCRRDAIESDERENWLEAEQAEINSIKVVNKVYSLVPKAKGMNILGSRWVYLKKFKPDHTVDKWKARWVAKGFKQKFGVDYDIVFAPTGRIESVRILLALASIYRMKVAKFDITTFFLTGEIDMDVYSNLKGTKRFPWEQQAPRTQTTTFASSTRACMAPSKRQRCQTNV